jgi:hypothetical protein
MGEGAGPAIPDDAGVVENLLKLGRGSAALSGGQICLAAQVNVIETGKIQGEPDLSQLQ